MTTIETIEGGRIQLNILTENGWIRHVFPDEETMEKYENKCYHETRQHYGVEAIE
jgi:hypothetical protein